MIFLAGTGCNDLIIQPPGTIPIRLAADPVSTPGITGCTITWTTNPETKHILEYGTATGVYTNATPLSSSETTAHSVDLAYLLDNTTYYYRIKSYYQTYQESLSQEYSFQTQVITPISIDTGPLSTPGQTSCSLAWTTNLPTRHTVEYGTASGIYSQASIISSATDYNNTETLVNLEPETIYYYRIRSFYSGVQEEEAVSTEYTFTTQAETPITINPDPSETPGQYDCTLSWTSNLSTRHIVEYGTVSGTYTMASIMSSAASTNHVEILSGLSANTAYYYRIRSFYLSEQESVTGEFGFTTLAGPAALAISSGPTVTPDLTSASISLTTNYATTTSIEYGVSSGSYSGSLILDSSSTSHTRSITGLSQGTTYYYRVHAYSTSYGNVSSAEMSFTTTAEAEPTTEQRARGIWIVGGCFTDSYTSAIGQVDMYDPVDNRWFADITTLPVPVSFAGVAAVDGKIYVIGGFRTDNTISNLVQIYDTDTGLWTNGATMSGTVTPRANISAAVAYGKIYIIGGSTGAPTSAWAGSATNYEYNIASDSWSVRTAVTGTASGRLTLVFNDVIYYLGGRVTNNYTVYNLVDGYMATQNALTSGVTEPVLNPARVGHAGVLYQPDNGPAVMVVIGGFASNLVATHYSFIFYITGTGTGTPSNTVRSLTYPFFAPAAWNTSVNNYPLTVACGSAALYGDRVYHFGGTTTDAPPTFPPSGSVAVYSADLDELPSITWTLKENMPIGRYGHAAVTF
jgi:hypothetical protein